MREYIETVIAPRLQGDGGWVEFVSLEGAELTLRFRGECSRCAILNRCTDWIARQVKDGTGQEVRVVAIRKKPFFWDT